MRASQRLADRLVVIEKGWKAQAASAFRRLHHWEDSFILYGCILLVPAGLALGLALPSDDSMPPPWNKIGQVAGWWYVLAWASCSYPQTLSNWRRQSVVGFSLDFAVINPIGFACLSAYYCTLYSSATVRSQYRESGIEIAWMYIEAFQGVLAGETLCDYLGRASHMVTVRRAKYGVHLGVHINDIVFALHAVTLSSVMAAQCCLYERGSQTVSPAVLLSIAILGPATLLYLILVFLFPSRFPALAFITWLSWIKMLVTMFKYLPQYLLNRQRKSTSGWSIWMVLLDFTGGVFSLFQLCLEAWVLQDLSLILGDAVKFGLGLVSITYNLLFILQHYVWYAEEHAEDGQPPELLELTAKRPKSPKEVVREDRARGLRPQAVPTRSPAR